MVKRQWRGCSAKDQIPGPNNHARRRAAPSLDRFGVTGDRSAGTAVGRVIAALAKEALPGAADIATNVTVLPNPGPAWARRVGGRSLWVYYRFDDSGVEILGVNVHPPKPLSDG